MNLGFKYVIQISRTNKCERLGVYVNRALHLITSATCLRGKKSKYIKAYEI
jgi:hypothetical protein